MNTRGVVRGVFGVARATPIFQVLFHKTLNHQTLKPQSPQTHKPLSPQTLKHTSPQILKPSNPQALNPSNHQALKLWRHFPDISPYRLHQFLIPNVLPGHPPPPPIFPPIILARIFLSLCDPLLWV